MEIMEKNEKIIEALESAKYLLRGHKQNLNVSWAISKINESIKMLKS